MFLGILRIYLIILRFDLDYFYLLLSVGTGDASTDHLLEDHLFMFRFFLGDVFKSGFFVKINAESHEYRNARYYLLGTWRPFRDLVHSDDYHG